MDTNLINARIYTDFKGFSELRLAAQNKSPEATKEVALQFEAIFIQMMLKSMREASPSDSMFDSDQSKMYMGMFDQQIAIDLAAKKSFGIAEMMLRQLVTDPEVRHKLSNRASDINEKSEMSSVVPVGQRHIKQFESAEQFLQFMRPYAERAAKQLGVKPDALLAQSALETGWGKKIIRTGNGISSYNLFAIKADQRWNGPEVSVRSLEYNDGIAMKKLSSFRVYDSFQESFDDYTNFILQDGRYQNAVKKADDPHEYIHELQKAGYATDPEYADKIIDIMDRGVI